MCPNVLAVCEPSGSRYLPSRDCLGDVMIACRMLYTGRVTRPICPGNCRSAA